MIPVMKKQISFSIFNEADYSAKQFAASRAVFLLTVLAICAAVCLTGFVAIRCNALRKTIPTTALLEETSRNQQYLLAAQTQQINLLNEKLSGLETKFEQLHEIKNKICKTGRIEQPVNQENFFGIGGSRAEYPDKETDAENDNSLDNRIGTNRQPDKTLENNMAIDPPVINDHMLVLNYSDFCITPIAGLPYSLPTSAAITENLQPSQRLFPAQNDYYRGLLLAPANGIITFVDVNSDTGTNVIIDHGHGYITRYACLKSVIKKMGELVLKGEVIGYAGTSSSETPSQFSYEILLNGLPVNPDKYITHDPFLL